MVHIFFTKRIMVILCFFFLFSSNLPVLLTEEASSPDAGFEKQFSLPEFFILNQRLILYQKPDTLPPENGYPVLFLLHGASQYPFSWFFPFNFWSIEQTRFSEKALDAGFFIVSPSSGRPIRPGPHAWSSFIENVNESLDLQLFISLFDWLENEDTFHLDLNHVFCAGFSSGGFMTSRLAKTFPHQFSGVLIHSGTDADSITFSELGPEFDCNSSQSYPSNHPPTLVVHGEKDQLVPYDCGLHFYEELQRNNITTSLLTDEERGHIWLSSRSNEMIDWFESFL